jgi:hypothetical protein
MLTNIPLCQGADASSGDELPLRKPAKPEAA